MKDPIRYLLLLGTVIAFLIPATVAADTYITMTTDDVAEYRGLRVATVDALDPLETEISFVTLEGDNLAVIPYPAFGTITRIFDPASGIYHGAKVTITESKSFDGNSLSDDCQIVTDRTIPNFTMHIPSRFGNVLMVKFPGSPEEDINFARFFKAAEEQGYLFTDNSILYSNTTGISAYGIDMRDYDRNDLNFTLKRNEVDLANFSTDSRMVQSMMETWPYTRPEPGEYLLAAVQYDSKNETLHVLAAMPVLILDGNPALIWNDHPVLSTGATVSFEKEVDRTAYALLRNNTTYDLTITVDTRELVDQPIPTSTTDLISLLQVTADEDGAVTYALTPSGSPAASGAGSGIIIAQGYGLSGYADGPKVEIGGDALETLDPGTYSLYALGMEAGEIVAVDHREVEVRAVS